MGLPSSFFILLEGFLALGASHSPGAVFSGEGTGRSGVSLCTGLSIFLLLFFLVLGFRLLSTIIGNVLSCCTGYLV